MLKNVTLKNMTQLPLTLMNPWVYLDLWGTAVPFFYSDALMKSLGIQRLRGLFTVFGHRIAIISGSI